MYKPQTDLFLYQRVYYKKIICIANKILYEKEFDNDSDSSDSDFQMVNVKEDRGEEIALNLTGQQDIIAASLVPCNTENCRLPYLPNNLQLRQGEDTSQPVIVTGNRNQDSFSLDINNFPLALLNLAPAKTAGIQGALTGKTTGNINLNLFTLAANGEVAVLCAVFLDRVTSFISPRDRADRPRPGPGPRLRPRPRPRPISVPLPPSSESGEVSRVELWSDSELFVCVWEMSDNDEGAAVLNWLSYGRQNI